MFDPIILIIVVFQIAVFVYALTWISRLKLFFKNSKKIKLNKSKNQTHLSHEDVDILECKNTSEGFDKIIEATNQYLISNKGAAADMDILKDICQRRLEQITDKIESIISLPLYFGLVGTFIGIVVGLSNISFEEIQTGESVSNVISDNSITLLLESVGSAMIASAIGLILTIVNSSYFYKKSTSTSQNERNNYYDFLQKELLPKLSDDVTKSLGTLQSTLDVFNHDFGENLSDYKENFKLLNENLEKEKDFLDAINKIGLTNLSKEIIETFTRLSESKADFESFQKYQKGLNEVLTESSTIITKYNDASNQFSNFNSNLEGVSNQIVESSEFYTLFKNYLETHFGNFQDRNDKFSEAIDKLDENLTQKLKDFNDKSLSLIETSQKELQNKGEGITSFLSNVDKYTKTSLEKLSNQGVQEFKERLEELSAKRELFQKSLEGLNNGFISTLQSIGNNQKNSLEEYLNSFEDQTKRYNGIISKIEEELNHKVNEFGLNSIEQREKFNIDWRGTMDEIVTDIKEQFSYLNTFVGKETEALVKYIDSERIAVSEVISANQNSFKDLESITKILELLNFSNEQNVVYQKNMSQGMVNINDLLSGDNGIAGVNKNLLEIQKLLVELNSNFNKS